MTQYLDQCLLCGRAVTHLEDAVRLGGDAESERGYDRDLHFPFR